MFKINLSKKVTKKNGTMYLAVFSVPITDDTISQGKHKYWQQNLQGKLCFNMHQRHRAIQSNSFSRVISDVNNNWKKLIAHADTTYTMVKLTKHHIPEAKTFNLLESDVDKNDSGVNGSLNLSDTKGKQYLHIINAQLCIMEMYVFIYVYYMCMYIHIFR